MLSLLAMNKVPVSRALLAGQNISFESPGNTHMLNTVLTKKTINYSDLQEFSVGLTIMCSFKVNIAAFAQKNVNAE